MGSSQSIVLPLFAAVAVAALAGLCAYWTIGVISRRRHEARLGLEALARLKWREFTQLTLAALYRRGYRQTEFERQPGDGGFDFLLEREGARYLLSCKHGRAYHLGEPAVRELSDAMRMQSAQGGLLLTQGEADAAAQALASRLDIQLLHGKGLWNELAPLIDADTLNAVRREATSTSKRRLGIAVFGSLVLGLLVYVGLHAEGSDGVAPAPVAHTDTPAIGATANPTAPAPSPSSAPVVTTPTEQDLAQLRADIARQATTIPGVASATWASTSTLVLVLADGGEFSADTAAAACQLLVPHQALRYSRLQIEPASGSDARVRWRPCR